MNGLKQCFNFYVNSSIHVALAVLALVVVTVVEYSLQVSSQLYGFIFLGTITGYNFVKYAKVAGLHHRSLTQNLKAIQIFSGFCAVGLLGLLFYLDITVLIVSCVFGGLTFFYAVPFKTTNLRAIAGIKITIVALVWAGVTVFVPMVAAKMPFTMDCWITFFQRFLLVVVLTLPFEIRDLQYDRLQLKTVPQQLGVFKTKLLGSGLLVLVLLVAFFKNEFNLLYFYSVIFVSVLALLGLIGAKKNQSKYFASFWVEGIPMAWCVILLLLRHFLT